MANTFNLGNGNWAQKTEKLLAYNAENDNYKPLPFDFDRGSTATRVNRDGLIETVGVDEPRIDFLNNTKGHLLLEPSRQNLNTYSEDLTTGWTTSAATVTADTQISPDGSQTADTITVTGNSGGVYTDNITVIASTSYTFSFYVKRGTISDSETALAVRNQTAGTFINTDTSYSANADNWTRIEHTFTTPVGCTSVRLYPQRLSNGGQGTTFIWGCQLEQGSYATSYIPTSGSAVTRSAETCNGAGNSNVFNDSEGVLYAEIAKDKGSQYSLISLQKTGDTNTYVYIGFLNNTTQIKTEVKVAGTSAFNKTRTFSDTSQYFKVALKYKSGDYALWINGFETDTGTSTTIFSDGDLKELELGNHNNSAFRYYGKVKDIKVYNTALSDSELQALTS